MISIPTFIIRITIERIVSHQAFVEIVVRTRIVGIRSICDLNRISNPVPVRISLIRIGSA